MTWDDITGNDRIIKRITSAATRGRVPHACVIEGDARVDKSLIAACFAKALLCETRPGVGCGSCAICRKIDRGGHEDVVIAEADGNSVKDEAIEALQEKLKKKPFAGERSVAVIRDADTMTRRAQNRLLKTLEEPHPGTAILLLSENVENLEKTILSRCVVYRFAPFFTPEYGDFMEDAEALAEMLLTKAPFYKAKAKMMALADGRENAYKLLDAMETIYGGALLEKGGPANPGRRAGINKAILAIEEARRDLRRGMNIGYTLKHMILAMMEVAE